MVRKIRLTIAVALTIVVAVPADAEENFKLLKAKQIRATVVGKDISDDVHWSEYYRREGALISVDMGTTRAAAAQKAAMEKATISLLAATQKAVMDNVGYRALSASRRK